MEKITDLQELLKHELKDLYSAEVQLIEALPKMAEKATNTELKKAFTGHLKVTREHQRRLDKIQAFLNMEKVKKQTRGFFANLFSSEEGEEHCKAMEGLIKEAEALMEEDMTPEVMDAALIAAAQKVEHYEISSYGTARAYATQLGFGKVVTLLSATLEEEYAADDSLTVLAVGKLNIKAENSGETPVAAGRNGSRSNGRRSNGRSTDSKEDGSPTGNNRSSTKRSAATSSSSSRSAPKKSLVKKSPRAATPAKKTARKKSRSKA